MISSQTASEVGRESLMQSQMNKVKSALSHLEDRTSVLEKQLSPVLPPALSPSIKVAAHEATSGSPFLVELACIEHRITEVLNIIESVHSRLEI